MRLLITSTLQCSRIFFCFISFFFFKHNIFILVNSFYKVTIPQTKVSSKLNALITRNIFLSLSVSSYFWNIFKNKSIGRNQSINFFSLAKIQKFCPNNRLNKIRVHTFTTFKKRKKSEYFCLHANHLVRFYFENDEKFAHSMQLQYQVTERKKV